MGDGAEQVVLVGVGDRTAAGAGHCGTAHAVVGIGRHIAPSIRALRYQGALGVVGIGDGAPVSRGHGGKHVSVCRVAAFGLDHMAVRGGEDLRPGAVAIAVIYDACGMTYLRQRVFL